MGNRHPWIYRLVTAMLVSLITLYETPWIAYARTLPTIAAQGAVLINGRTGQVLYQRHMYGTFQPASITKIMTAFLAITHGWQRTVVVTRQAQMQPGASLHLKAGQRLAMPVAVRAMMLSSANDAAVAISDTVSGSVPAFVGLMNRQAQEWHAPDVHFQNPDGLSDPHLYVSALGMAVIAHHAMANPIFRHIVACRSMTLPHLVGGETLYNRNLLLYQYPGAIGIKMGYTARAGATLVGAADRHGALFIVVLLHDTPAMLWPDAESLLDFGFQTSQHRPQGLPRPVDPFLNPRRTPANAKPMGSS